MLAACAVIAWAIFYSMELPDFGHELFGGALFAANLVLWKSGGYFHLSMRPLLHLWSLAVEEQFYLVWPPIVVIAARFRWNRAITISVLLAASLLASVAMTQSPAARDAAFYLPVTRLWEILAGALLLELLRPMSETPGSSHRADFLAIAGGILLVIGFVVTDASDWIPGLSAVLPVAGTTLLITAGPAAFLNRFVLSRRAIVAIGLISYPLYLWHWPLLVFGKTLYEGVFPVTSRVIALAVALLLSAFTYQIVELPIRYGAHRRRSALLLLAPLAAIALTGASFYKGKIGGRLLTRFEQPEDNIRGTQDYFVGKNRLVVTRVRGASDNTVLFIGDSHSGQYLPRARYLAATNPQTMPTAVFITYGGCAFFPHVMRRSRDWDGLPFRCPQVYRTAKAYAARPEVKTIVVGAYWERYRPGSKHDIEMYDDRNPDAFFSPANAFTELAEDIRAWMRAGKTVYVINSNPTLAPKVTELKFAPRLNGITNHRDHVMTRREIDEQTRASNQLIEQYLKPTGASIIDPVKYLCNDSVCPNNTSTGVPIYLDKDHLGPRFVAFHASYIDDVFKPRYFNLR